MENISTLSKSDLKFLLKIYRQLFLQYLELNNINIAFAQQIKQLRELLLNFRDVEDLVLIKDTKMHDALNYLEKEYSKTSTSRRPKSNSSLIIQYDSLLEKLAYNFMSSSESLQLRQQNLTHHLLTIFTQPEIVQPKLILILQTPHISDKQVTELLPYVAPIDAIKKTQTGFLLKQLKFLQEDYLISKREGTELQYIIANAIHLQVYVVNQAVLLSQIGQVVSRELAVVYAKEDKINLQLQDYLQKQAEIMQAQSQFILRPRLTPFTSRSQSKQGNKGEI